MSGYVSACFRRWSRDTYRFVKEEERRIFKDKSRYRETLLLASTDHHPALADHGIVPIRERTDRVMHVCAFRCLDDLFITCFHVAVLDVVSDSVVKQWRVLWYDTNRFAQAFERHVANVLAVDKDTAFLGVVVSEEQAQDGGFSAAGGTDDGNLLACWDREVQVLEDRSVGAVSEGDILELDFALGED
jgi:hypothetical protein